MVGMILLLVLAGLIVLSAVPLYLAVKLMGGEVHLSTLALVNIGLALLNIVVVLFFSFIPNWILFLVMLLIYKNMFNLGWVRTFLAWVIQFAILYLLIEVLSKVGLVISLF